MPCRPGQQGLGKWTALPGSRSTIHVCLCTCFSGPLRPRGKLQTITRFPFSIIVHNILLIFFLCRALLVAGASGIVYCEGRDDCVNMADSLNRAGLKACSYYAGKCNGKRITYKERDIAQNKWNGNECQVALFTFLL